MIYGIIGWTMIVLGRNQSVHFIREIIVPDDEESGIVASLRDGLSLPKLMRGEARVSE